jgi:phosphoglycolate phosphatase-like HAD superfamily hydrolase
VALVGRTPGLPPKPDPAPLLRAREALDAFVGMVNCVGDGEAEMAMARAAAGVLEPDGSLVRGFGLARSPERRQALLAAGAEEVFADLGQLTEARVPPFTSRTR